MKIKIDLKIFAFIILLFLIKKLEYYFLFMLFIILHEIGHLITGILLGYKPKEISLNITGISLEFYNYNIDKKDLFQILILISGPIVNIILAVILYYQNIEFVRKIELVVINMILAIINMLPILPLDGGKILKILIKESLGYKKSIIISERISKIFIYTMMIIYSACILYIKNIGILLFLIYVYILNNKECKINELRLRAFETLEKYKIKY